MKVAMENLKATAKASVLLVAMIPFGTVGYYTLDRWVAPHVMVWMETMVR